MFGLAKRVLKGASREVAADYSHNKDYLEAVCAAAALVANADGNISDQERTKTVSVLTNHPTLGKMYRQPDIEATADVMFKRAKDGSGRQLLARELDDIKGRPNGAQMAEDVYLVAQDVAAADGEIGDDEKIVLGKIASRLGVDVSKFDF